MDNTLKPSNNSLNPKVALALKAVFWLLICGLSLKFIIQNALPYFSLDAAVLGRWFDYKWWLISHISGGLLALVLGPFQFWKGFRTKYIRAHRILGGVYLGGILMASIASTYLAWTSALAISSGWAVGLQGLAVAWFATSLMAFRSIRRRKIQLHKEWMIRSYVVTLAFVSFRLLDDNLSAFLGGSIELSTTIIWVSWTIPLLFTNMILDWNKK